MRNRILNSFLLCALTLLPVMPSTTVAQSTPKRIVVSISPEQKDMDAALTLQDFMRKGGLNLYIVSRHDETPQEGSIYVGNCPYINTDGGYSMFGDGNYFVLSGDGPKGSLYAVYDFLERYCGFRLYTPDALVTPDLRTFLLPSDTVPWEKPAFAYREVLYYYPENSRLYADWHRLNTSADRDRDWGLFVHTFDKILPSKVFYEQHPEWYSMRDGQRLRDGQLCLSNRALLDTLTTALSRMIADKPDKRIWSVSPNDNYNVCQCPSCLCMDSIYGGPSGTLLHFVNQVARRFPDKTIATLAYQYTRNAPYDNKISPDSNVLIMLCPIEADRAKPIVSNPAETSFRNDLDDWHQLCQKKDALGEEKSKLFLWDYVVQFRNFWNPFPNLHVLKPNLQYFRDKGVDMMFEQASGARNKTSWMELRTYLIAKLMWNPDLDVDSLTNDFCNGYYGAAGRHIKSIIDTMTSALVESGNRLDIYGYPIDAVDGYLKPQMIYVYDSLMALAYETTTDSTINQRLRYFELSLDFATVELATNGYLYDLPYTLISDSGLPPEVAGLEEKADYLVADLNRFGVRQMMEMGISPNDYGLQFGHYINKRYGYDKAFFRDVILRKQPTAPYTCDRAKSLTDGVAGIMDYRHNWIGFFGDTLDATITLFNKPTEINEVSMDFFFFPLSWIFMPQSIEYRISDDGKRWTSIGTHHPENPEILATPTINTITTKLDKPRKARYLRVIATPLPAIPSWHRATGNKAWIFTDEIIIK